MYRAVGQTLARTVLWVSFCEDDMSSFFPWLTFLSSNFLITSCSLKGQFNEIITSDFSGMGSSQAPYSVEGFECKEIYVIFYLLSAIVYSSLTLPILFKREDHYSQHRL